MECEKEYRERKLVEITARFYENEKLLHQRDKTVNELREQITGKIKMVEMKIKELDLVKKELAELQANKEKECEDLN